jgi:hypothetical protein
MMIDLIMTQLSIIFTGYWSKSFYDGRRCGERSFYIYMEH